MFSGWAAPGVNRQLPPRIDELGPRVHEIEAILNGMLSGDGLGLIEINVQQIDAVDATARQRGPTRPDHRPLLVARFHQHLLPGAYHTLELSNALPFAGGLGRFRLAHHHVIRFV